MKKKFTFIQKRFAYKDKRFAHIGKFTLETLKVYEGIFSSDSEGCNIILQ